MYNIARRAIWRRRTFSAQSQCYSFFVVLCISRCWRRSEGPSKHCRNHRLEGVISTTRKRRHKIRYKNTKSILSTKTWVQSLCTWRMGTSLHNFFLFVTNYHHRLQPVGGFCVMRNRSSSVSVNQWNHIASEVVAVSRDESYNSAPRNPTCEQNHAWLLPWGEKTDYEKSIGEEGSLQGNEVHAHFEIGIPPCPIVQYHVSQRNTHKEVTWNHAAREAGKGKAEKQHPHEIRFMTRKGIRFQSPHTLCIENSGHEKPDRERSRIYDG